MPAQPDNYEPTDEDIEGITEQVKGNSLKPQNLAAGIASAQRRIAQLEAEKHKLLDRMNEDADESLKGHLAAINKDLATARERLVHYEGQLGKQN